MSKIALLGDVHLADRAPSMCTETYLPDLFDLLYQAIDIANAFNCSAIVQAGDLFHIKMPSRNSLSLVQKVIDWAKSTDLPIYVVPGNHDLSNDRMASLDEGQPLGVLFAARVLKPLIGWSDYTNGLPIYGVPWLQEWDADESIADAAVKKALVEWNEAEVDTPYLVITHAPFFPPGSEPPYESYSVNKFAGAMDNHGSVYYGHIHEPHGSYVIDGVRFCNNGAISRGSLTEYNLQRQVGLTIWDSVTDRFEFVEMSARPASEVFRISDAIEKQEAQLVLTEFLASIGAASIEMTSIESVMDHVKSLNKGKEFEKLVEELLF